MKRKTSSPIHISEQRGAVHQKMHMKFTYYYLFLLFFLILVMKEFYYYKNVLIIA